MFMKYVKGKLSTIIFESSAGYRVGIFRVYETNISEIPVNKTITFTGHVPEMNRDDYYILKGSYVTNYKYGKQFEVKEFEKVVPEEKDTIIEFLSSSFIKGCGVKTAEGIYNTFGKDSIEKIKEKKENLFLVPKMTEKRAESIYNSIIKYSKADDDLKYLKNLGFNMKDSLKLIEKYSDDLKSVISDDIFNLIDDIDFKVLDYIFLKNNKKDDERRVKACIIEAMKYLTFEHGDIYLDKVEIVTFLNEAYNISVNINDYLEELHLKQKIVIENEDYYLYKDYIDESYIATCIKKLLKKKKDEINNFDKLIKETEKELKITYNKEQKEAIKKSLVNNISLITGGPGTGKTTITEGIINVYKKLNKLNDDGLKQELLLLAPTGRAATKLFEFTGYNASTIHRFLKWDKDNDTFSVNEYNKQHYKLIIVDESSMLDNHLTASLFRGLNLDTKIIFVGDEYQLPSIRPGLILADMINSKIIPHTYLENIYRQSDKSFIPVLAKSIKENKLNDNLYKKKDDYSFIKAPDYQIKDLLKQILIKTKEKNIDESKIQVLAPMYRGTNGIDAFNKLLQNFFNPKNINKNEIKYYDKTLREGDKIMCLENDLDNNISNGDIGFIASINPDNNDEAAIIDYDGNFVTYRREMLSTITHAYCISIHKSQGSEYDHVIMPIIMSYSRMLYNKLIYTGVSRAKKSLILLGDPDAFIKATSNNYSLVRKTTLKQKLLNNIKKDG